MSQLQESGQRYQSSQQTSGQGTGSQQFSSKGTGDQQFSSRGTGGQQFGGQVGSQQIGGQQASAVQGAGGQVPTAPVRQLFPTRSYLPETTRRTSIGILNQCLADLTTLNMQLKSAHWNVKGQEFYQLHELFEDIIEEFDELIDETAERASALGGHPPGTVHEVAQNTTLPALPQDTVEGVELVAALSDRIAVLDQNLFEQLETVNQQGDLDTADLLNEVSREVSKSLWFLEAHLQRAPTGGSGGGQSIGTGQQSIGTGQQSIGTGQQSIDFSSGASAQYQPSPNTQGPLRNQQ